MHAGASLQHELMAFERGIDDSSQEVDNVVQEEVEDDEAEFQAPVLPSLRIANHWACSPPFSARQHWSRLRLLSLTCRRPPACYSISFSPRWLFLSSFHPNFSNWSKTVFFAKRRRQPRFARESIGLFETKI